MNLDQVYKHFAELLPDLQGSGQVSIAQEGLQALAVRGGNERLNRVRSSLERIKTVLNELPQPSRSHKTQVLLMLNAIRSLDLRDSYTIGHIAESLDMRGVAYHLIAPWGDDEPYLKFKIRFPRASWRFVDWSLVPDSRQFTCCASDALKQYFSEFVVEHGLANEPVFVTTGIVEAHFSIALFDLLDHAEVFFTFGSDMLFVNENADWAFDLFHEGEAGVGLAPFLLPVE